MKGLFLARPLANNPEIEVRFMQEVLTDPERFLKSLLFTWNRKKIE